MSFIEEKLDVEGKLPPYYRRYVDDTFTVMPDLSTARDFLNTLTHAHPTINFTTEVEIDGMLPFLGTLVFACICLSKSLLIKYQPVLKFPFRYNICIIHVSSIPISNICALFISTCLIHFKP